MILQVKTERELITALGGLSKLVVSLQTHNKELSKKLEAIKNKDESVLPTLKKLSARLKALEDKTPATQIIKELTTHEVKSIDGSSKKELAAIKKSIAEIKPVINNVTQGVTDAEVLSIIDKRVTIHYVNKLYKKGK